MTKLKDGPGEENNPIREYQEWAEHRYDPGHWLGANTPPQRTLAVGAGQMSRVDAANVAVMKAREAHVPLAGSVCAWDAFFPFRDGLDVVANAGAKAVIAADDHGIAMVSRVDVIFDIRSASRCRSFCRAAS